VKTAEAGFVRKALRRWYEAHRRDLPWRRTRDPYRIWVSEIMLQQTRVAAVIPYYEKFLKRYPSVEALARAPEAALLAAWSGLGYYSRARNMQKAARQIVDRGGFPESYAEIRELAGVGDYTAAAVASIAFGQPRAVVDGNVLRVLARITAERGEISALATRGRLAAIAQDLLDRGDPAASNQALMELGALVCVPRSPDCVHCPVARWCAALREGIAAELPVKAGKKRKVIVEQCLALAERRGRVLMRQRAAGETRLAGFWEVPLLGDLPGARVVEILGEIRHHITYNEYRVSVVRVAAVKAPAGLCWRDRNEMAGLPLTTLARKALKLVKLGENRKKLLSKRHS
jgi:A/G-specific adenine glycosylase